jgi:RecB family exonuclease
MTAHRSKGLEWQVVVVAGVQADQWPDLRRRGSVLGAELLSPSGPREPVTVAEQRREERRLFYVALTRARRKLVVTAVEAPADDGLSPSPFLDDLDVPAAVDDNATRHAMTLPGVVADLRSVVIDSSASPAFRAAAAERLAMMARERVGASPVVPAADPSAWWGTEDGTRPDQERDDVEEPLALELSGSQIETIRTCPLQWYLSRRVRAESTRGTAAGFGGVLHALADAVARGELPPEPDVLEHELDRVWDQLQFAAQWESDQERAAASDAIARFVAWHTADRGRQFIATEHDLSTTLSVLGQSLTLTGRVDRLERDSGGGVVVVDLKTMARPPSDRSVEENLQLATYRRLVSDDPTLSGSEEVTAELVQLRVPASMGSELPKVQRQTSASSEQVLAQALEGAVATISSGQFPATPGKGCKYCQFQATCPAQPLGQEVLP